MLLIVGDLHMKPSLSYAEYIKDGRKSEKKEILDFIVNQSENCDSVVFLGDQLNSRTNSPEVIREFVNFLERFEGKEIYIISGNHESFADGRTALDFLKEIKNKKWHIITNTTKKFQLGPISATFCPYFTKSELEVSENSEAIEKILEKLEPADLLFHHHTMGLGGKIAGLALDIDQLPEPVLPIEKLQKMYKVIFGGHIHKSYTKFDKAIVTGSIFNNEVGETQKYVWKIDETAEDINTTIEQIELPGRKVLKLEDPTIKDLEAVDKSSIVKVIITKKVSVEFFAELKISLKRFDAYILLERIPKKRKKMHYTEGESILEFRIEDLLKLYAKEKEVSYEDLKNGFDLIRE